MQGTKDEALATAVRFNATILAAQADADAAKHAFRVTDGAFVPTLAVEGRVTRYDNTYPFINNVTYEDYSGRVVMSWDIFRGGQDVWKRSEAAERSVQATMAHARLQRDALESIDKAWNARTITRTRIGDLVRQLAADRKTIAAFDKEYELGQRSLIDLLNAQNQYFNAAVSLTSARSVVVFADYQLLAAMWTLLEYLNAPPTVDAAPLDSIPFGLIGYKLPTLRLFLPQHGSDPLRVPSPAPEVSGRPLASLASAEPQTAYASAEPQTQEGFKERWASWSSSAANIFGASGWLAQNKGQIPDQPTVLYGDTAGQQPLSYAATEPGK